METLTVDERLDRIENALSTLAWWLVEARTGFGERDAQGIVRIIETGSSKAA